MQNVLYFILLLCSTCWLAAQTPDLLLASAQKSTTTRVAKSTIFQQVEEPTLLEVKKVTYVLRKMDDKRQTADFQPEDATFIELQLMDFPHFVYCKSHTIDNKVEVVFLEVLGKESFNHREFVNTLYASGYAATGMRALREKAYIAPENYLASGDGSPQELNASIIGDCEDVTAPCDAGKVSKDLIQKYQTMDGEKPLIDLGSIKSSTFNDE